MSCGELANQGEQYVRWRCYGSGDAGTVKMHPECHAAHQADAQGGQWEFTPFSHDRPQQENEVNTPKPQEGIWTLTAPDGQMWRAESPIRCVSLEQRERVPADVALARVMAAASEPDFADRHVQLGRFYSVENTDDLIDKMERHIARLQEKIAYAAQWKNR